MGRLHRCRYGRSVGWTSKRCTMNDSDHRDEIVLLEAQIDELTARIESCRKFILVGRIAVVGGGAVLTAMLVSAIQFDPSVMALAVTAVLGGIVADAILTAAGNERLTKKWVPGERDLGLKVRDRRLARYRKKTAESIMERAELREKIAVGLELCRQAESK